MRKPRGLPGGQQALSNDPISSVASRHGNAVSKRVHLPKITTTGQV